MGLQGESVGGRAVPTAGQLATYASLFTPDTAPCFLAPLCVSAGALR
jgi:hypothetical protein